ncbi:MAG TPA: hypothetical protein VHB73_04920, partial [Alphaproteobacteria bacterium]|nr:hypothetical protein [Alphaproteobacteria bacterium]
MADDNTRRKKGDVDFPRELSAIHEIALDPQAIFKAYDETIFGASWGRRGNDAKFVGRFKDVGIVFPPEKERTLKEFYAQLERDNSKGSR